VIRKNKMKRFLLVLGVTFFAHGTVLTWNDFWRRRLNSSTYKLNVYRRDLRRILKKEKSTKKDADDLKRLSSKRSNLTILEKFFFRMMLNNMVKNYYEQIEDGSINHYEKARSAEKLSLFKRQYRKCLAHQNKLKRDGTEILPGSDCKSVFSSFGSQYFGKEKKKIMEHLEK